MRLIKKTNQRAATPTTLPVHAQRRAQDRALHTSGHFFKLYLIVQKRLMKIMKHKQSAIKNSPKKLFII